VQKKLYLALTHAITSHCLSDPLTGCTGTELALGLLRSAGVRSFRFLQVNDMELLGKIAAISPVRAFYPLCLEEMRQIGWNRN
jgi:hypothetical protein